MLSYRCGALKAGENTDRRRITSDYFLTPIAFNDY
jgi:hypothetical protein